MGAVKGCLSGNLSTQPASHCKVVPPWSKVDSPKNVKIKDDTDIKRELSYNIEINNNVRDQVNSSHANCLNSSRRLSSKEKEIALLKTEIETLCKQLIGCHGSALAGIASKIQEKKRCNYALKVIIEKVTYTSRNTICLSMERFESILSTHNLIINKHWRQLLPMCLEGDLEAFYKKITKVERQSDLTYDEVSDTIKNEFVPFNITARTNTLRKLTELKRHPDEHFELFVMRFKKYVKISKIEDDFIKDFYFLRAMKNSIGLYQLIMLVLTCNELDKQTAIDHVINVARAQYTIELELQRRESKEANKLFRCKYHSRYNTHNTKDCRVHKANILQKQNAAKKR